jgi:LPS-assembly lipoprotein
MQNLRYLGKLLVLSVSMAIAGCGFQLRGSVDLPGLDTVRVTGAGASMREELAVFLREGGVKVTEEVTSDADAELALTDEQMKRRVLSVDPSTGKAREYELAYSVDFQMVNAEGTALVRRQTVRLVRDFVFDVDAVIGKSREEGVLRAEMRRDAVQQIIRRLRSSLAE